MHMVNQYTYHCLFYYERYQRASMSLSLCAIPDISNDRGLRSFKTVTE